MEREICRRLLTGAVAADTHYRETASTDLPDLSALQAKLKRTHAAIDRTLARVTASERRMAALDTVDTAAVGRLALETFGSAEQAYAWVHHPNKALGQRTLFSLLTSASEFGHVETLLRRMAPGVPSSE